MIEPIDIGLWNFWRSSSDDDTTAVYTCCKCDYVIRSAPEKLPNTCPECGYMRRNAHPIKYVAKDCPKCGRHRVELWTDGLEICEKCLWCEQDKTYHIEEDV